MATDKVAAAQTSIRTAGDTPDFDVLLNANHLASAAGRIKRHFSASVLANNPKGGAVNLVEIAAHDAGGKYRMSYVFAPVDAIFPNMAGLWPNSCSGHVTVNRKALADAIKSVTIAKHEPVRFDATNGEIVLTAGKDEESTVEAIVPLHDSAYEDVVFTFRPDYLQNVLGACRTDEITIKFNGSVRPLEVVEVEGSPLRALFTPFRVAGIESTNQSKPVGEVRADVVASEVAKAKAAAIPGHRVVIDGVPAVEVAAPEAPVKVSPTVFAVGRTYWARAITDSQYMEFATVTRRTDKSVWVTRHFNDGTVMEGERMYRINDSELAHGYEFIRPDGNYSMAIRIRSDHWDGQATSIDGRYRDGVLVPQEAEPEPYRTADDLAGDLDAEYTPEPEPVVEPEPVPAPVVASRRVSVSGMEFKTRDEFDSASQVRHYVKGFPSAERAAARAALYPNLDPTIIPGKTIAELDDLAAGGCEAPSEVVASEPTDAAMVQAAKLQYVTEFTQIIVEKVAWEMSGVQPPSFDVAAEALSAWLEPRVVDYYSEIEDFANEPSPADAAEPFVQLFIGLWRMFSATLHNTNGPAVREAWKPIMEGTLGAAWPVAVHLASEFEGAPADIMAEAISDRMAAVEESLHAAAANVGKQLGA